MREILIKGRVKITHHFIDTSKNDLFRPPGFVVLIKFKFDKVAFGIICGNLKISAVYDESRLFRKDKVGSIFFDKSSFT
ncbi:hypothetical protein C7S20_07105 [Christiangramia fulva]|uniref:Uncharacterized protein n=1 Tax=Christiangramia fulva TaxID=2126553 RepID=A0A2R3Z459_9FLAO|nr:hypothetical protein C7S20_07105 [Christiangramia fulva]